MKAIDREDMALLGRTAGHASCGHDPADRRVAFPVSGLTAWYALVLMAALVAMSFVDRGILSVVAQPLAADFDLDDRQLGLLMGAAFAILYAFVGLPISQLLDRGGRVRLLGAGAVLWGTACLVSAFASGFATLALCRGLLATGEAVLTPAAVSLIPDLFPRAKRALPMSIYFATPAVALPLTYVAGGAALDVGGMLQASTGIVPWRSALAIIALPSILLGLLVLATVREPTRIEHGVAEKDYASLGAALAFFADNARFYAGFYVGMAAVSALWMGVVAWLPTALVRAHGYSPAEASYLLGLLGVPTTLAGSYIWPAIASALENRGWAGARGVVLVGTMLIVTITSPALVGANAVATLAAFGWMSFTIGAISPTGSMALQSVTPPRLRARATAIYTFSISAIAFSLGPYAVAVLADGWFARRSDALLWGAMTVALGFGALATLCLAIAARPIRDAILRELQSR